MADPDEVVFLIYETCESATLGPWNLAKPKDNQKLAINSTSCWIVSLSLFLSSYFKVDINIMQGHCVCYCIGCLQGHSVQDWVNFK